MAALPLPRSPVPDDSVTSVKVPFRLLRKSRLGALHFTTYRSGHPSLSKSPHTASMTPPSRLRSATPAIGATSVKLPSPLLRKRWQAALRPDEETKMSTNPSLL